MIVNPPPKERSPKEKLEDEGFEDLDLEDGEGNKDERPLDRILGSMFAPLDNGSMDDLFP